MSMPRIFMQIYIFMNAIKGNGTKLEIWFTYYKL